jgi:hypothetical protein
MMIRLANIHDIQHIEQVYERARAFMRSTGNETQWGNGYPSEEIIVNDIEQKYLYVIEDKEIQAAFTLILGEDPTYLEIDGAWLNDQPYATLHRIASKGSQKGMFKLIVDFAWSICPNLRIDTHKDNMPMRHLIEKNGFDYCGIIIVGDGTPRLAYQKAE